MRDRRIKRRDKPAIAIDFDGTIADYTGGYQGPGIFGELLPGAREALVRLAERFDIIVHTARGPDEHDRIQEYLEGHGIPIAEVTHLKRPAALYIDDRGLRFSSWKDTLEEAERILDREGIPGDATLDLSELDE
jgi:hypothetical protein